MSTRLQQEAVRVEAAQARTAAQAWEVRAQEEQAPATARVPESWGPRRQGAVVGVAAAVRRPA
jgi:hypothetical protein